MNIAVLSGKGGTGKTLTAVNLAAAAGEAVYIDCDVEEPNGHLFFKPAELVTEQVPVRVPVVDPVLCDGCRLCVDFCRFHALAMVGSRLMVFEELCHSCSGCALVCPVNAISERDRSIGHIEVGTSRQVRVQSGFLDPGEASGIPIIKKLRSLTPAGADSVIVDCPPGSACIVMESIQDVDYCVMVAEPTLFGLHNLKMVHELVRLFQKPHGVVLNKCLDGDNPSKAYCRETGIPILLELPFDAEIGQLNSRGKILVREQPRYREVFQDLLERIRQEAGHETAVDLKR